MVPSPNQMNNNASCYVYIILSYGMWNTYYMFLLKLSNDIESNPGPESIHDYAEYLQSLKGFDTHLKFCLLNARNIVNKRLEFESLVSDHGNNCIFAVTETWFKDSDTPNAWTVNPNVFSVFVCNRSFQATGAGKGGGVMLFIPTTLNLVLRTNLTEMSKQFESLWVECNSSSRSTKRMLINGSYCPHKHFVTEFLNELASDTSAALNENKPTFLLGDYNCNYLSSNEAHRVDSFFKQSRSTHIQLRDAYPC